MMVSEAMRPAHRIGIVGLGKVGLALALVMRHHGMHSVVGWDVDPAAVGRAQTPPFDLHPEQEMRDLLRVAPIPLAPDLETFVQNADTIFICVPTPHPSAYDGTTPMAGRIPVDFDYEAVRQILFKLSSLIALIGRRTIVLVSTVTPGRTRELMGVLPTGTPWAYQPVFISLGTVVANLLNPDYILVGTDVSSIASRLRDLWTPIVNTRPLIEMSPESAELSKLALNVTISMQIAWINQLALLSDSVGADIDDVVKLFNATQRLKNQPLAGLGDGGACRPRDAVALDRVFLDHDLRSNLAQAVAIQREEHSRQLAVQISRLAEFHKLPVTILGRAYRPDVPYEDGSPSLLLANDLRRLGVLVEVVDRISADPAVYVLAHPERFAGMAFPAGSVVFDPWGAGYSNQHVKVVTPGRPL